MKSLLPAFATALALLSVAPAQTVVADLKAYGTRCGDIQIIPNNPLIGQNFTVTTKSKDAFKGVIALGLKRANLAIGGGCSIYVEPIFVAGWSSTTKGQSVLNFPLPNDSKLLGQLFTVQTAAVNSNGVAFSRGVEGKIGNKKPKE